MFSGFCIDLFFSELVLWYFFFRAAFSFKPRDGPVGMPPAPLVDEEDESDARARRTRKIAFLENEIQRYTFIKKVYIIIKYIK